MYAGEVVSMAGRELKKTFGKSWPRIFRTGRTVSRDQSPDAMGRESLIERPTSTGNENTGGLIFAVKTEPTDFCDFSTIIHPRSNTFDFEGFEYSHDHAARGRVKKNCASCMHSQSEQYKINMEKSLPSPAV